MSVVLFCTLKPKKRFPAIDEKFVTEIVQQHAKVNAINIFSREVAVKCFIQVDGEHAACSVIANLHRKKFIWGTLQIYRSCKTAVFGVPAPRAQEPAHQLSNSRGSQPARSDYDDSLSENSGKFIGPGPIDDLKSHENSRQKNGIGKLRSGFRAQTSATHLTGSCNQELSPVSLASTKQLLNADSRTIVISNFDIQKFNIRNIASLLGCFGNVIRVVANPMERKAFAEFDNSIGSMRSQKHLNKLQLFGLALRLVPTNTDFSLDNYCRLEQEALQIFYPLTKFFRFKDDLRIKVNPPSCILHFTSIDSEADPVVLFSVISAIQEPRTLYLLKRRSQDSKMYLVEFDSPSHAAEVLSVLHNKQLGCKLLKISFSSAQNLI
jgi:hypothetical protein